VADEKLPAILLERGYVLWNRQYADSYDLRREGAGTIRVVLWHPSDEQTRRADITVFENDPYGPEHAGTIEVSCDPATRDRLGFLVAVLDAAEAQLR
jgi:hypothetical protein